VIGWKRCLAPKILLLTDTSCGLPDRPHSQVNNHYSSPKNSAERSILSPTEAWSTNPAANMCHRRTYQGRRKRSATRIPEPQRLRSRSRSNTPGWWVMAIRVILAQLGVECGAGREPGRAGARRSGRGMRVLWAAIAGVVSTLTGCITQAGAPASPAPSAPSPQSAGPRGTTVAGPAISPSLSPSSSPVVVSSPSAPQRTTPAARLPPIVTGVSAAQPTGSPADRSAPTLTRGDVEAFARTYALSYFRFGQDGPADVDAFECADGAAMRERMQKERGQDSGRWLSVQGRGRPVHWNPAWTAHFAKYPHEACTPVCCVDMLFRTAKVPGGTPGLSSRGLR
jgi:hypothetical protein